MKKKKEKKINYVITSKYKTDECYSTEDELIRIFNEKYFKTIMKIEKSLFGGCNV